jgi:hypothetical protein
MNTALTFDLPVAATYQKPDRSTLKIHVTIAAVQVVALCCVGLLIRLYG